MTPFHASVVFTASRTLFGRLIRWVTKGRTSHVIIVYEDLAWGGRWAAEATVGGVRLVPAKKSEHNVVASFACLFDARPALQALRSHVGDPFDYAGLALFGWTFLVWRWFHRKVRRPWHSSSAEFCSELVTMFLQESTRRGLAVIEGLPTNPEKATPEHVLRAVEASPSFQRLS